jgi:hypothetical protein
LPEQLALANEEIGIRKEHLNDYLKYRHPTQALPSGNCTFLAPKGELHYFFEGEYRVGD